jgi:hypothetical protein
MPSIPVIPVFDKSVRGLCARAYEGHSKGCPNFGCKERCPPKAPLLDEVFDMNGPFFAIYSVFALGQHVDVMRAVHPDWSYRRLSCVLYWQGTARKKLRAEIEAFRKAHATLKWLIETTPEAFGCDVFETMRLVGIELPWPPREFAYHVALAGFARAESSILGVKAERMIFDEYDDPSDGDIL